MKRRDNGDGSIRQRKDGLWELRVSVGKGLDGKHVRKSFYGKSKADVKAQYKAYADAGAPIEASKTVGAWAMQWLEIYKHGKIAHQTYLNYKMYLDRHIIPALGAMKMDDVRPAHLERFYATKSSLSAAARRDMNTVLCGVFSTAVKNRLCSSNPAIDAKPALPKRTTVDAFALSDVKKILEYAPQDKHGYYLQILLYTGLRVGELVVLMWSDIDLQAGVITVQRAAAKGPDGEIIKGTKTDRVRVIGINEPLDTVLRALPRHGLYVIADDSGDRVSRCAFFNRYRYMFDRMKRAGYDVPFLSPHKCRHTYATYMLAGGANLRAVQAALGHTTVTTTEIYTHVDTAEIVNNVRKLKY